MQYCICNFQQSPFAGGKHPAVYSQRLGAAGLPNGEKLYVGNRKGTGSACKSAFIVLAVLRVTRLHVTRPQVLQAV